MNSATVISLPLPDPLLQKNLTDQLGIGALLGRVLLNRGFKTAPEADAFLNVGLSQLIDPFRFADMEKAVSLVRRSVSKKKEILLCGDYDVDGVTAVAVLKEALRRVGVEAGHYLPHRIKDGYGLNPDAVRLAKERTAGLVITADCGISNAEEIAALRAAGIEVIVTDHHEPATDAAAPEASCILNPKLPGSGYPFRELAGVGVAYKLCEGFCGKAAREHLDIVALGTIADVVPLRGENRVFARFGLDALKEAARPGIRALLDSSRFSANRPFNAGSVSFILGPRINASGRMDSAELSLRLLLSNDQAEAVSLAGQIEALNRLRQKEEGRILAEAEALINREINFKEHRVIVVAKESWHQGVLGIVAAKLADKFYRPTILISKSGALCKGSGRSIRNFHLFDALNGCQESLHSFGGHSHAVGLMIAPERIEEFRERINEVARRRLMVEDLLPRIEVDAQLGLDAFTGEAVQELARLEPFGTGNPEPLFLVRGLRLKAEPETLARETLKFWATDGGATAQFIGFGMARFYSSLREAQSFDVACNARIDSWQGRRSVILEAQEIFLNPATP